jgi:hypothetical protein
MPPELNFLVSAWFLESAFNYHAGSRRISGDPQSRAERRKKKDGEQRSSGHLLAAG